MSGTTDISWMIGGPQGTGVDSSATLFARAMTVAGYWVYGKREYHSNIKGKHSYFQVRVKDVPVHSNTDPVHILSTFEHSTAEIHADEVVPDGAFIYDPRVTDPADLPLPSGVTKFPIEFGKIIEEIAEETGSNPVKLGIMKNTVAVAASAALLGVEIDSIEEALKGIFTGKKAKLVDLNMKAAEKAYAAIKPQAGFGDFVYKLEKPSNPPKSKSRLLVNGATATGLGKVKAGCRYQTYYSITPAVDECIYLEQHPEFGIVVFQCEDELSAINMAIGAATTGIRSSTSTSGPGFCLMSEGIGWAGINEVPMVVFNYQRGGPSTGLPTRNEQGELLFAIHAGHGDYPKIVMAPGDMHECFEDAFNAFNFAERYQTPVIVLPDKALANNTQSIEPFEEASLKVDRGQIEGVDPNYKEGDLEAGIQQFPRFKITDSGISPRVLPGTPGKIFWTTGDEHTEFGHITEKPEIRIPMHEKRMKKLDLAAKEIPQDLQYKLFGSEQADLTMVAWGSTKGAILDAMDVLKKEHNITINFLQIRMMSPFPSEGVGAILKKAKKVACIESNLSGQLAQLVRMRTSFEIPHQILKYTGRPISETEIVASALDVVKKDEKKVVLTYGR
ncbi:MAG: 2-oxoacid:acceptor oxidoreductase subunit alpha [Vampirovibrio sp.]|nr:2-oxoacid:acceptor oxidoreductase subunit alpha [Vampirovibrio sp.]